MAEQEKKEINQEAKEEEIQDGGSEEGSSVFTYTIAENEVTITGLKEEALATTNIDIPAEIEGKSVTTIGENAFKDNTTIETVTMADTVTKIEAQAFCNCTSIAEITLSNNLKSVGKMAFRLTTFKNIKTPLNTVNKPSITPCT